jgi:hypothetical protein
MADVRVFRDGSYRFVNGAFPYSAAVAPLEGFDLRRARFHRPVPLADAFKAIEEHLKSIDRPITAFCACELRSPAPFTEQGFAEFNKVYVGKLVKWNIFRDGVNPVARSNVCPEIDPPETPSFHAFSYPMPARAGARASFIVAGSAECPEGQRTYRDYIVRRGDESPEGLREKARWVLGEMERRMAALGFGWAQSTAVQLYTVRDVHPFIADELVRRGATASGLTWHYTRPPVVELDYEMDCRGVSSELVV